VAMRVTCHECGNTYDAPDEYAGRNSVCPKCHAALVIPATQQRQSRSRLAVILGGIAIVACVASVFTFRHSEDSPSDIAEPIKAKQVASPLTKRTLGVTRSKVLTALETTYKLAPKEDYPTDTGERQELYEIADTGITVGITSGGEAVHSMIVVCAGKKSALHAVILTRAMAKVVFHDPQPFFKQFDDAIKGLKQGHDVELTLRFPGVAFNFSNLPFNGDSLMTLEFMAE
jgi:hypothetical protein